MLIGLRKLRVKKEVKRKERHFGHMWGKKKDAYNEILLCVCRMMCDGKPLLLLPILYNSDFSGLDCGVGSVFKSGTKGCMWAECSLRVDREKVGRGGRRDCPRQKSLPLLCSRKALGCVGVQGTHFKEYYRFYPTPSPIFCPST